MNQEAYFDKEQLLSYAFHFKNNLKNVGALSPLSCYVGQRKQKSWQFIARQQERVREY